MFNLATQPMTLGNAISNTFKLWRATLASVLPLSVAASLLNGLPLLGKQWVETHTAVYIMIFVVVALINLIPTTAVLAKIGHAIHDQTITSSQALAIGLVKYPKVLGWVLIFGVSLSIVGGILYLLSANNPRLFIILFLFFFLLLMVFAIYFLCVFPIIIFENLSLFQTIRKSYDLTKNQWWYGGWLLTVVVIFNSSFNIAATYLLGSLGSIIVYCFTLPLQSSMIIVFYEHLKSRAATQNIIL